jgi:hypothetical protein
MRERDQAAQLEVQGSRKGRVAIMPFCSILVMPSQSVALSAILLRALKTYLAKKATPHTSYAR